MSIAAEIKNKLSGTDFKSLAAQALQLLNPPKPVEAVVGLDFNHSRLFAVEVQVKGSKHVLTAFHSHPMYSTPAEMGPAISALFEKAKFSTHKVSVALSGSGILVRFIQYPRMPLADLKASMQYEIEKYIPFPADDVIADFHILNEASPDKKNMKVILVTAKKAEIFSLIETVQKANLKIRGVDINAFACLNAFNAAHAGEQPGNSVLLDIGLEASSLMVVVDREPAFIREISIGSRELTDIFKRKIGWDDSKKEPFLLAQAVSSQPEAFLETVEAFSSQVRVSINYFASNNPKAEPPKTVYFSGELCALPEFQSQLKKVLGMEIRLWDCLRSIETAESVSRADLETHKAMLPVAIGLALRG